MRVIQIADLKRGGGKPRQLGVAAWPQGNVIGVEVGSDRGARSVRWLTLDGTQLHHIDLPTRGGPNAALSADLRLLAYVLRDPIGDLMVLEKIGEPAPSGVALRISEIVEGEDEERLAYLAVAISGDARRLRASTKGGGFVGWEIGEAFKEPKAPPLLSSVYVGEDELGFTTKVMAFLTDGGVVLGQDKGCCWFMDKDGKTCGWIDEDKEKNQGPVRCLAVSPDGSLLLLGIDDQVEGWLLESEIDTYRKLGLRGHHGSVTALAFSPDGKTIATADEVGVVRFWDANSGAGLKQWDWKVGRVGALAFSPDGFTCVAGGDRGRAVVWDLDDD